MFVRRGASSLTGNPGCAVLIRQSGDDGKRRRRRPLLGLLHAEAIRTGRFGTRRFRFRSVRSVLLGEQCGALMTWCQNDGRRTIPGMREPNFAADMVSTEEALDALGLRWRSGKFVALAGDTTFGLHLDAGRIIFATSTQRSLRLGHLLLRLGVVQPSFLEDVLQGAQVLSNTATLGRVLVREGAISRADLATGVEEQCIEVLTRMIDSPRATFVHPAPNSDWSARLRGEPGVIKSW